jgi:hypothetical protein
VTARGRQLLHKAGEGDKGLRGCLVGWVEGERVVGTHRIAVPRLGLMGMRECRPSEATRNARTSTTGVERRGDDRDENAKSRIPLTEQDGVFENQNDGRLVRGGGGGGWEAVEEKIRGGGELPFRWI